MATVMSLQRHTILIVDDEPEVLDSLRRILRAEEYRILTSQSPEEALQLVDSGGIDLLLSDVDMPGMSGLELVSRVRRSHPEVVRMLLTGRASLESALQAINDGEVHRYLTKPWDKAALRETLRQALDRLDELRRVAAAARTATLREKILAELEREHPGIGSVERQDGIYVLDARRLDGLVEQIAAPGLRSFFER
jgi:DNA-binding NtrC family response regulator